MKTATVRDLRYDFPKIEAWLRSGEEIQITKHNKPFAVMRTPPRPTTEAGVTWDADAHKAWRKSVWKDRVFSAAEVEEMRAYETGES